MKTTIEKETPILEALQILSPDSSKTTLKSWVQKGRITVDGCMLTTYQGNFKKGQNIEIGQRVSFTDLGIKILYEDQQLVVIDKPEGLLSVETTTEKEKTAHAILKKHAKCIVYPVHRLDRETSGVMVFTYTENARDRLKEAFAEHSIKREYFGVVENVLKPRKGTWESLLQEDNVFFVRPSLTTGKRAVTHYELLSVKKGLSVVRFTLETGRKNQIRVHSSAAGHPIVGDKKYGSTLNRYKRLCLHAHVLGFKHPLTGKEMEFISPLPPIFSLKDSKK
jgi:23S rRNA pseudouridine1911/1915/1917 synthase